MAIASSLHTMSANKTPMSSNGYLSSKNELTMSDEQLIDILLHSSNAEQKCQGVIRWCKNPRRNRLSTLLDVSQRYDVLVSLINTLQQTNNTEYQYNCLTLVSELQNHIHHYDQRIYLPGIIQCFSSSSTEVQSLACQLLAKQIRICSDIGTFLFLYTEEGLKSSNIRQRIKSIQSIVELLSPQHQYENLSPVLEVLLQTFQDPTFHSSYHEILHQSIRHIQTIVGSDLFKTYMDTYPSSVKRIYYSSMSTNETDPYIPTVDTDIEDEEETPRASVQVSQLRDSKEKLFIHSTVEDLQPLYQVRKSSLTSHSTPLIPPITTEQTEFNSIIELMRSKWLATDEPKRLEYLDRFKQSCEKYLQIIRNQHLSNVHETQFHQVLHRFLSSILDLLNYLTSSNLDLSIKLKLVLSTCLGWLIKQAQVTFCKKNYKTICHVFKNILLHGQSNNRQLAKLSVSLILLLENFVSPQLILNELIDENFQYQNYRIQLELLAIVTATLVKYRQQHHENLAKISKEILPMLISNRRELRHGALECFTMICSYFNGYKPISITVLETNSSIKLLFTLIENVSMDASNALRFRLQRNLLPSLTDEGNITPGLVCDASTMNDPDTKYILLVTNSVITPQPLTTNDSSSNRTSTQNPKQLSTAIPPLSSTKNNVNDSVLRTRDILPLKGTDMDLDLHRVNVNHRQQQQHQTAHFNRRMILPNKRQTPIATVVTSTAPPFDFALTGNRPLTLTEKIYPNDWNKKATQTNHSSKEPVINLLKSEHHHNNILQVRPSIPRRSSLTRFPVVHQQIPVTSQNLSEQEIPIQSTPPKRPIDSEFEQDEGIDSAIESRSLSITTSDENDPNLRKKSVRSVHSSSTRRKAERLFSNGSDLESGSARTITPENSNESGVYSQSGRDIDYESHDGEKSTHSFHRDQLFSTRPRLARSGSKSKLDRSQLPPTDPSLSSRPNNNHQDSHRSAPNTKTHVEIVGKGYTEEKYSPKTNTTETMDDKASIVSKSRAKIIRGSVVAGPLNTTTHTNVHHDDNSNLDDAQDIGVIGKAVHLPQRTRLDSDRSSGANPNKVAKRHDSFDIVSDEFDSDSKENENFAEMGQSLSASFRLRVQQKTQEKIEQKERRRQDREIRRRQLNIQQPMTSNSDLSYDTDIPVSSTSTSRYSSQPDLVSLGNDLPPTPRRPHESNGTSILPNVPSQQRLRVYKNSMARSQTFNNRRELATNEQRIGFVRPLSEDRITDQLRNPEAAYREAMESVGSDDWERKCSGLGLLQRLIAQYPDVITQNLHQVVLILIQEVKNLRSQVARFALATFCDMFIHLKRNMDIELDLTVKAVMQKSGESNEFLRSDAEKCLQSMIDNVTLQKGLQALIAGGASHRNPAIRKTSAKYIYLVCEKLGPTKILSGTRDITERVLQVAATFASDGPPEIRWYGKKIYHMLMPFDELDSVMKHYLNPTVYTNMCDILDNIRAKGGVGETPSESARNNVRRTGSSEKLGSTGSLTHQFSSVRKINNVDQTEQVRDLTRQMRSSDFRERLNGIEEFQKLCELETETATQSLVPIFDGFNECLADTNSKVLLKALNTMHQLIPILGDALSSTINSTLPIVAHNIASKNREISQVASDIIDTAIEYIDCGCLLQPLCTLCQNSNLRVRPEIVLKLATLVPRVCQRKPKQVEIHLLPTYWKLLALLRGQNSTAITSSAGGSNSLNTSIHVLTTALYAQYGSVLIDKASSSSLVTPKNLQVLRDLCANIDTV